jgi:hypothetical protein
MYYTACKSVASGETCQTYRTISVRGTCDAFARRHPLNRKDLPANPMKKIILIFGALFTILLVGVPAGASATTITFESLANPGTGLTNHGSLYVESGFQFSTTAFYSTWNTGDQSYPGSTALFENSRTSTTTLSQVGGGDFSIVSISLAPLYFDVTSPQSVTFTGILPGGLTTTETFLLPGTNGSSTSETLFPFTNPLFSDVTAVQFSQNSAFNAGYQFDNVTVSALSSVPDSGSTILLMLGALVPLLFLQRKLIRRQVTQ